VSAGAPPWHERAFRLGVLPVAGLHVALSLRSALDPRLALLGDRALTRIEDVRALLAAPAPWRQLAQHGGPGDYAIHALPFALGGLPLVLAVQLLAFLASLYALYVVARELDAPAWAAGASVTAYALLPSNLHQPHTLVTEALVNPLLALVTLLAVRALRSDGLGWRRCLAMGAALGVAAFVRPVVLPAVPGLAAVLWRGGRAGAGSLALLHAAAVLPLATFAAAASLSGAEPELGGGSSSLGANLFRRMKRIEQLSGRPLPEDVHYRASIGEYLAYGASEPAAFVRLHVTDTVLLTANTGVNHTFGRFLGLFPMREGSHYWTPLIEERGLPAAARELLRREPARLLANAAVGAAWLLFAAGSALGLATAWRDPARREPALAVAAVGLCSVLGAYASHYARWSQRSPAELGMAALLAVGLARGHRWWATRRQGARPTG